MIIGYDGDCAFCIGWVRYIINHDPKQLFRFVRLQSDLGQSLIDSQHNKYDARTFNDTVVLIKGEQILIKFRAVQEIVHHLEGHAQWLRWLRWVPLTLGDFVYSWVAKRRHWWGRRSPVCELPGGDDRQRFLG